MSVSLQRMALLLAALSAIGPFAIDTYLPAFHAIGAALHASDDDLQWTLAIYMATFAFMSLWHGAISDCFGRRVVIITGGVTFLLASLICAVAPSIEWLWFGRALQGMAAGAGIIVGRAMIRDLFEGAQAQRLMSRVATIFALAPAIAPMLGGWITFHAGWRAIFWFLVAFSGFLAWLSWKEIPETLPPAARKPLQIREMLRAYLRIFSDREFFLLSAAIALTFNGFFVHIAAAPTFLIRHLGLTETQFGWLFVPFVTGLVLGSTISSRVAGRWSAHRTVRCGFIIMGVAVTLAVGHAALFPPGVPASVLPIGLYSTGMSLAAPSLMLLTLELFPERRGMVASCQTFLQVGLNAVTAKAIAPWIWGSTLTLELGMCVFFALGLVCYALWWQGPRSVGDA
ncbi:MAG: multidrug effflux MFS transporter [Azoarcus sp.]|jgi:DHA1 family bicyclomycin/chloramphenicol resistance-like MFS transporter|nr:multidrug effflux MFS transporter [Azoarcus sp.]